MSLAEKVDNYLAQEYPGTASVISRDLALNFKKLLEESSLEPTEIFLNLLAIAVTLENKSLAQWSKTNLQELGVPLEQIREAAEIAGIMGMNNTYYKFKSYLPPEVALADYARAGLRMNSLNKHLNTKKDFEMMSLAVSIINACSVCVASHEKTARAHGASAEKIHDLARLAAVCKGLSSLKKALTL